MKRKKDDEREVEVPEFFNLSLIKMTRKDTITNYLESF